MRPFPRPPTREKSRQNPVTAAQRPKSATGQQRGTRRRIAVPTREKDVDRDR